MENEEPNECKTWVWLVDKIADLFPIPDGMFVSRRATEREMGSWENTPAASRLTSFVPKANFGRK